jgi:predicted RNase H-like nuclease
VDTKKLLADRIIAYFAEARERRLELSANPKLVEDVLRSGAQRLAPLAQATMQETRRRMGLGPG